MSNLPATLLNTCRVVVVEDNTDDEALTLRGLTRCPIRHMVAVARDGQEAVNLLVSGDAAHVELPRLVLLDLKLPKLDGHQVLQALRENERTATVPVVCMTSSDEPSDVRRCYRLGANSFVLKPVDYEQYLSTVAKTADYWLGINHWDLEM